MTGTEMLGLGICLITYGYVAMEIGRINSYDRFMRLHIESRDSMVQFFNNVLKDIEVTKGISQEDLDQILIKHKLKILEGLIK